MKLFLDTGLIEDIRQANAFGILDGVTTNPSLIAQTGKRFREVVQEICAEVAGPVSAEAVSLDAEGILAEARDLMKIADNIVVKVPVIPEGIRAIKMMAAEGIRANATLCFSAMQALAAAKAGAAYISPFVGRRDDTTGDGMELVRQIRTVYDNYDFETEIIVAAVRGIPHVLEAALIGADVTTMGPAIFQKLLAHPQTDSGLAEFLDSWKKVPK
jgi:transaldolase